MSLRSQNEPDKNTQTLKCDKEISQNIFCIVTSHFTSTFHHSTIIFIQFHNFKTQELLSLPAVKIAAFFNTNGKKNTIFLTSVMTLPYA